MASINRAIPRPITHEGAPAHHITPFQELRRSVSACLLWEDSFYESGIDVAERICALAETCAPSEVMALAVDARTRLNLRHAPLLLCAKLVGKGQPCEDAVAECVRRADEPGELLSIHWKMNGRHIPRDLRRGLRRAMTRFDAYQFAKYDRGAVKPRDVMRLVRPKPASDDQAALWRAVVKGQLPTPDTWETVLSSGADKKEAWTRLLSENRLGGLALLRNLRNMTEAGVDRVLIRQSLDSMSTARILPFRFIAAALHAPWCEPQLEAAMFRGLDESKGSLKGDTVILVDVSGSMSVSKVSTRSEMTRRHAAASLACAAREMCENVTVIAFSGRAWELPPRRGFGLIDLIMQIPAGGTNLGDAVRAANSKNPNRIIVVTDEQSHQRVPDGTGKHNYMINVASYRNGVGYGAWTHIDGFSESVLRYIVENESS